VAAITHIESSARRRWPRCTAKAALAHCTRLAAGKAPRIRLNAIAVGAAPTSALDIVLTDEGLHGQLEQATPRRRIGDPREVAASVVFLASSASGYITGKILEVDGGIERAKSRARHSDL